jgi:hypothetical protein
MGAFMLATSANRLMKQNGRGKVDLKTLINTPPWDWPKDAGNMFQVILSDRRAQVSDRLIAAELAGSSTVINDDLAGVLMAIVGDAEEPEELRAKAALSLGPVLEQSDMDGFEDPPDDVPISEITFRNIQDKLHRLYLENSISKEVRRRILEASVRAPQNWHQKVIMAAYSSGDKDWMLTAVFSMRWIRGFEDQILEALKSFDPDIHCEAVSAAGNWELDAAWPHIVGLLNDARTSKPLLLAAIGAASSIRPQEAGELLIDLAESHDEEIAEAANEAITFSEPVPDNEDEDDRSGWIN